MRRLEQLPSPDVERSVKPDTVLFAPEGSAEGCASGDCLPGEEAPESAPAPAPAGASGSDAELWRAAVDAVRSKSPRHGKSLSSARFLGFTDDRNLRIAFPPAASFHRSTVFGTGRTMIEEALTSALGRPTRLVEETDTRAIARAPQSLAEDEAQAQAARSNSIEGRVRAHPALKNVLKVLGGSVEHIQILDEAPAPSSAAEPDVPPPVEDDS